MRATTEPGTEWESREVFADGPEEKSEIIELEYMTADEIKMEGEKPVIRPDPEFSFLLEEIRSKGFVLRERYDEFRSSLDTVMKAKANSL